jgi:hypothetical protein
MRSDHHDPTARPLGAGAPRRLLAVGTGLAIVGAGLGAQAAPALAATTGSLDATPRISRDSP